VSRRSAAAQELLNRGYNKEQIHKILGLNLMRVFRETEKAAAGDWTTDCERHYHYAQPIDEPGFWAGVAGELAKLESSFRAHYHRIRGTCTTCDGTGDCCCKRKGQSGVCERCCGSTKCHVCDGKGRVILSRE
jgi:hypothetical protein